jgi:RHH-type proline utilization regulon transcriptional repressor/proline dehydrogenase/delta 1-pyrroline-5-carboxylate dehydrogenase
MVPPSPEPESVVSTGPLESQIRQWGERIFARMDTYGSPSLFSKKGFYGTLMEWAMRDEHFKTQLFRFVDVLPSLSSSAEITRHLQEYLGEEELRLSPAVRVALKASTAASWLFGAGVKQQTTSLARQFMLGNDEGEIIAALRHLHDLHIGFTVDLLGETVLSEREADQYAARYLRLLDFLAREAAPWPVHPPPSAPAIPSPRLNVSIKISALYSQIRPADPETALECLAHRMRPILRRAKEVGALINFDMEQFALKDLTLALFKKLFAEPEFAEAPACGLALQAYLRSCERDLRELIAWAKAQQRRLTVRLVKGAYWDYETVLAGQRGWPVPVFAYKSDTDVNFEKLTAVLLENHAVLDAALGTHNVRSIANTLAQADRLKLPHSAFEFQMLFGMADPIKRALADLGCRVREYCPVGELLPGIAYLVRRLLENTSNEGFLAHHYAAAQNRAELLNDPRLNSVEFGASPGAASAEPESHSLRPNLERPSGSIVTTLPAFRNAPLTDFTVAAERERFRTALRELRPALGRRLPLVINNRSVSTHDWLASRNPANQDEVIGYAAQAGLPEADAALLAAGQAQPAWARTPVAERAALLERLAALFERERARLSALEILEAGKNWTEADADVVEATDFCNFYAAIMRELAEPQRTQRVPGESNFQDWWPRGIALVIAPWNFPLAILTGMTVAAVVTGNAVIIKPSDQTPVIASRLMELLIEAGAPGGVVNLLTGPGSTVGAHLVAHPQIDLIAFTGSREVGLQIWETAGRTLPGQRQLKKVICEMGGKNALIVDRDADLDEAVAGVITSAFGYAGQKCSALSRLIVLAENYDRFLERLLAAAAALRIGPAEEPGNAVGPVISRAAQERILKAIEAGKSEAHLAWQSEVPDAPKACYVPLTIFTDVPPASRLFRDEIFGPVLSITEARDFDEALNLANDSEFALTGGLYSRSPRHVERARAEMVCGNLYINRPITGAIVERQPFGGFKMSGGGTKAGGREYLQNFLLPRVVTENRLRHGFAPGD